MTKRSPVGPFILSARMLSRAMLRAQAYKYIREHNIGARFTDYSDGERILATLPEHIRQHIEIAETL